MQPLLDATVYIVDDDASVRDALSWLLRTRRLHNVTFVNADAFIADMPRYFSTPRSSKFAAQQASCLLLDVRMPGTSGLTLFEQLLANGLQRTLPVIFLTGHADVATAVDAVKRGAFDFCEKPFSNNALVDRIEQALLVSATALEELRARQHANARRAELTEREQAVMDVVVQGLPNKLIADRLGISVRTVEVHRSRVFEKMGVKSAVELANVASQMNKDAV